MKREYNSDEHKHWENEKLAEIADLTHFHSNIPAAQFEALRYLGGMPRPIYEQFRLIPRYVTILALNLKRVLE